MRKITDETEWKANDDAPMPTKGKKGKGPHYNNRTTNATGNRFPWTTIVMAIVLLAVVGFVLFVVNGMS